MKKILAVFILLSVFAVPAFAETYFVDMEASGAKWEASKVAGKHNGRIDVVSGILEFSEDRFVSGEAVVDMHSIVVDDIQNEDLNKKLTDHLKSADFFDVVNHPMATIKVTQATPLEGDLYDITADVTIKNITQPVNFQASVVRSGETVQASARITLDRTAYDIRYGSGKFFENLGDRMIHDEFHIEVMVEAKK